MQVRRASRPGHRSARLEFVLLEECDNDLDDSLLLATGEASDLVEELLDLSSWGTRGARWGVDEELLDVDAKSGGEAGQDVGARGLGGALPERNVGLRLANDVGKLSLAEASGQPEFDEPLSLFGSWSGEFPRHVPSVRARSGETWFWGLLQQHHK